MNKNPWEEPQETIYMQSFGFADGVLQSGRLIRAYANAIGIVLLAFVLLLRTLPFVFFGLFRLIFPAIRIYNGKLLGSQETLLGIEVLSALSCYLVATLLLIMLLRPRPGVAPVAGGCSPLSAVLLVLLTLGASTVGSFSSMVLGALLSRFGLLPKAPYLPVPQGGLALALTILMVAVLPAVFEELLFRGLIQRSLLRFGERFALVVSTLLFALLHQNLAQIPTALLSGLLLGYIYLRTRRLWVVILCHFCNNLFPVLTQTVSRTLSNEQMGVLVLCLSGVWVVLGILSMFLLAWKNGFFLRLQTPGRITLRFQYRSFFLSLPVVALVLIVLLNTVLNMLF